MSMYQHLEIKELEQAKEALQNKLDSLPTKGSIIEKSDLSARVNMIEKEIKKKKESLGTEGTFEDYIKFARNKFVKYINAQEWDNKFRTESEDILIAFDQMREKLFNRNSTG